MIEITEIISIIEKLHNLDFTKQNKHVINVKGAQLTENN